MQSPKIECREFPKEPIQRISTWGCVELESVLVRSKVSAQDRGLPREVDMDAFNGSLVPDQHIGLLMDKMIENVIYAFSEDIVRCVDLQKLVPHLLQQHLLTKEEEAYLVDEREDHSVRIRRHLIPLLMKEGSVGLVGFYAALLAASMEHPGHTVLAQRLRQEIAELAKPDEEVLLERNYLERAAAIDEYCFYSDLLDQSQSVTLTLCKRLKKHITGQLTGGYLQLFAISIGMSFDTGMKILEDHLPSQHYDMVVSYFLQGKCKYEATPIRVVFALAHAKGLGRLFCHVSDLWGNAHGAFTDLLAKLLVYDWPTLARHLGYTEKEINNILDNNEDAHAQVAEFLRMWRIPDCGPHTSDVICQALWCAKLDSVQESYYREAALLVADLNYGVILAHHAERLERRERRQLDPSPKVSAPQAPSVPTARLSTPAVPAWEVPQWQRKLRQWPATKVVEATQGEPEEAMQLQLQPPPTHVGLLPHEMADVVQESNAVCDEHVIATSPDTEALHQNAEVEQIGLKAKLVSSDLPVHRDKQQSKPQTKIADLSCSSADADRESKTISDQLVHPVEETPSRQVSQSSEAAQAPSPALLESDATRKPASPTLPPTATGGAEKLEQCSINNEQPLSISPPSDDRPVPVTSDTAKESPVPMRELSDDDRRRPTMAQPISTPPLDVFAGHDNFVHSPSPTFEEQGGHGINPLWQVALGGIPGDSTKETVSEVKNTATNELNILSGADDDVTHPVAPVEEAASASRYDHADVEQLYEACLAQLTSGFVLRNTIEYPRFVSDAEHYLVFHRAASPQAKKKASSSSELLRVICAQETDLDFIIALVDSCTQADLEAEDKDGATAFYHAATRGLYDVVKALIHKGVEIDSAVTNDALGRTPLLSACASGHVDVVGLLLEHGANPNRTDLLGRSGLLLASVLKNLRILYQLLEHGASVNVRAHTYNTTPLALACLIGEVPAVHILLDKGADPSGFPASETGLSPLAAATIACKKDLVEILLEKGASVDSVTPVHYTPLHIACFLKRIELVKLLIARGATLNFKALRSETPLMAAVSSGSVDVVNYLRSQGADVSVGRLIQDEALTVEVSPLGEAALAGQESVFESLMEFDLDVNFAYKGLVSVLCLACIGGNVNIVDYLLKTNDIDLSVGMSLELTLVSAMKRGNRECTQLILDHVGLDNIVSHGTRSGRKQLLAALQPFQTHVAPNDEQPAATPVEVVAIADGSDVGVVDIGAKASPVQMSNDLSAAMETDWEQQDFDPQSLTEVPTSVPEPKPPPLPASTSVPQQRQAAAEERASDRNESMTSYKGQSVDSGRRSERSGMDLMQLLRQSDMFHVRRDQLNLQSESTEMLKRLASLIRFLIIAAGDTGDLLSEALDNNHQHICQFLTEYNDGNYDNDAALLDRLKDLDGEPSTLVFLVTKAFSIDSLIHLAQGMDHQLALLHFRRLKAIMEKERRSGLSLHEILGIVGQSRLLDIHLTQEDGAPVAARPQAVAERDEAHMKSKVTPLAAVVPGVAAESTASVVASTDDSRMQTQLPLPTAGVPGPTAEAASSHVPPSDKSHVKTDSPTPISEVPPAESTVEQSQNNLNPDQPALNLLDVEEAPPPRPATSNSFNALDVDEEEHTRSNVEEFVNILMSPITPDARIGQVDENQFPSPQTVSSNPPNMSPGTRTEGNTPPCEQDESSTSPPSAIADGPAVTVRPDLTVPSQPAALNQLDGSSLETAPAAVAYDQNILQGTTAERSLEAATADVVSDQNILQGTTSERSLEAATADVVSDQNILQGTMAERSLEAATTDVVSDQNILQGTTSERSLEAATADVVSDHSNTSPGTVAASALEAAPKDVLYNHSNTSPDARAESSMPPSKNSTSPDSTNNPDSEARVPPLEATDEHDGSESASLSSAEQQETPVFPSDANAVQLDVSQTQQDPMHYDTSPNTPNHEPSCLQEAHEADGGADVKTVHQNNGYSNSACLDSGNSEFGSKTQASSTPTHGNTCSVCSYTEEVRIDTQNTLQKQLLRTIARAVDSCWTILARRLGVTEDIIEDIKSRSFTPPERCSALLKRLSGGSGAVGECTWSSLQVALCQIGRCDLVSTIAEEISGSSEDAVPQRQDSMEEPTIDLLDSKHLQLLMKMSEAMGSFWRPFCERQGLRRNDAETLSDTDKAFDLLIQWVKGQRRPTFQNLIEALREINLGHVSSPLVAFLANSDDQ